MKTALVTGGAVRVGRAICEALADKGYAIAIHYGSSAAEAETLAQEIKADGGDAIAIQADLSKAGEVEGLIGRVCSGLSAPQCLVNSASTFDYDTGDNFSADGWSRQMDINVRAPALLGQSFAHHLPNHQTGAIINILDQKIAHPSPAFFSYTISKKALEAYTELAAKAYAPQIRVCAVAPGLTLPSGKQTQADFEDAQSGNLLGSGPIPLAIAEAVLFLAEAECVTGQVIYVDGGERFETGRNDDAIIGTAE